jgi:hypothetical protein
MSWRRIEGVTVDPDLTEAIEARVGDPLWLLGRQWQTGEITGEDAGSPIVLEAEVEHVAVTRFRPGAPGAGAAAVAQPPSGLPLETAAEREPVRTGPAAAQLAAEAGLQLRRHLADAPALFATLRRRFPLTLPSDDGLDPAGRADLELLARRSCDARKVRAAVPSRGSGGLLAGVPPAVRAALLAWAAWYDALVSEPAPDAGAWDPTRLEYRFSVAAGLDGSDGDAGEVQLDAPEYAGGRLDWHAFDVADPPAPPLGAPGTRGTRSLRVVPTPVRYAGQAASRLWQVENANVWFGDIDAAPADLARVAVAGFGLLFGDDWYGIPCVLPTGVLVRGVEVTVVDTFGQRHQIRSCAERDGPTRVWRFFELTGDAAADAPLPAQRRCPWLFLPPMLPGAEEGRPVEEVVFRRDEAANLAWAAELRVESQAGRPVDRAARARAELAPPSEPTGEAWLYQLATSVPGHFVPLVPVRAPDGTLYLQRGRLAVAGTGDGAVTRGAVGVILEPDRMLRLHDATVPSTGVRVTRSWQLARSGDGGHVLWMGRRKQPAGPGRSPGLRYDVVVQQTTTPP